MNQYGWTSKKFLAVISILAGVSDVDGFLDFTCFNSNPRIYTNGDNGLFIAGYKSGDDTDASVSFGRTSNTGTSSGLALPDGWSERNHGGTPARLLDLPASGGVERIGAFYCNANKDGVDEKITTIIMSSASTITPREPFQTVSVGQQVTFEVNTNVDETQLRWRYNGGNYIPSLHGQTTYTIPSVTLEDAGVYECHQDGERGKGVHAIFQLIVGECPEGKWNLPSCDRNCPHCFNGGICDEQSGQCVCAPGFSGQYCTTVYGRNKWGQDGQLQCSGSDDHGYGCQGKLLCLPHPYGCSCAAGFKGLDCNQECETDKYGANCKQECHCSSGDCLKDTGECDSGQCEADWYGVNCQEYCPASDPEPVSNLHVVSTSGNLISLEWDHYENCPGFTQYEVFYQYDSTNLENCVQGPGSLRFSVTSKNCTIFDVNYFSTYRFNIRAIRQLSQSETFESTHGLINKETAQAVPNAAPTINLEYQPGPESIIVSWIEIPCEQSGGPNLRYNYRLKDTHDNTLQDWMSTPGTSASFTGLTECSQYTFEVRAVNDIGPGETESATANSVVIAPGPVTSPLIDPVSSSSLRVTWAESDANNCREGSYCLQYRPINIDQCNAKEVEWIKVTSTATIETLTNLLPYSTYEVSITPVLSIINGEMINMTAMTTISIPTGPPENIAATDVKSNELTFGWAMPECGKRHGEIIGYSYTLTESGGLVVHRKNTSSTSIQLDNLKPFTNYTFSLAALTQIGSGPFSAELDVKTDEAVPSAPTNLRLINIERTSMTATWKVPRYPNGIINTYTIQYHAITKPYDISFKPMMLSEIDSVETNADNMEFLMQNLEPSTEYRVVVTAHSMAGAGEKATVEQLTDLANSEDITAPRRLSYETDIGQITSTTVAIKIQTSDSIYVTSFQIRVQPDDNKKRQVSTSEYIAAELMKSEVSNEFVVGNNQTIGGFYNKPLTEGETYTLSTGAVSRINDTTFNVIWSEGLEVTVTPPSTEFSSYHVIIGVCICLLIAMAITMLVLVLKIRSLNAIIKILQNEKSLPDDRSLKTTTQDIKSMDNKSLDNTSPVTLSADGYAEYKVTKNGESAYQDLESTYQDLDNPTMNRRKEDEEYDYVNESIMKSKAQDTNDGSYENTKY